MYEKKIRNYVENKCYEVLNEKDSYIAAKEKFLKAADSIRDGSLFFLSEIDRLAAEMKEKYRLYIEIKFTVSQIASVTGNKDLFERLCVEGNND